MLRREAVHQAPLGAPEGGVVGSFLLEVGRDRAELSLELDAAL